MIINKIYSWITSVSASIIFMMIVTSSYGQRFNKEERELFGKTAEALPSCSNPPLSDVNYKYDSSDEQIERFNRVIEKTMQFINILGPLDSFINHKAKMFVKKLNAVYNIDNDSY